ncbi:MAG: hypothetical protein J6Y02_08915 [Pseudobutyrivibrio sp.]|nr:hypothetical protein [Pseudobutyrivibrio sp.]
MSEERFIDTLGLSKRTLNVLTRANIKTEEDISSLTANKYGVWRTFNNEPYKVPSKRMANFGQARLVELVNALKKHGIDTSKLEPGIIDLDSEIESILKEAYEQGFKDGKRYIVDQMCALLEKEGKDDE